MKKVYAAILIAVGIVSVVSAFNYYSKPNTYQCTMVSTSDGGHSTMTSEDIIVQSYNSSFAFNFNGYPINSGTMHSAPDSPSGKGKNVMGNTYFARANLVNETIIFYANTGNTEITFHPCVLKTSKLQNFLPF